MRTIIKDLEILPVSDSASCEVPKITLEQDTGKRKKLYIESYGCQMNYSDSEIVTSIMQDNGFDTTSLPHLADVIFLNTCSIRENAEQKVRNKLAQFNVIKKNRPTLTIGVLGCMAERLKAKFLEEERIVDLVAGPDSYRDLPNLLAEVEDGSKAVNVFLSREETYADISPVRLNSNGITAFISIMRGCDNMCSFCVVPFTRGRERSRDPHSIIKEAESLIANGFKEVTLLGQNVDSYKWNSEDGLENVNFAQLLEKVASLSQNLRVRFSTSHPKDITDEVLYTMKRYENICKYIHLPAQSGNDRVLKMMNRTYTRDWYINRVDAIKSILGEDCGISTDMISGFCSETEEEHRDTLSLMEYVRYHFAYMFTYSERPGTLAEKKYADDVPEDVKQRRLEEVIALQSSLSLKRNNEEIGKKHVVLAEGYSKKSDEYLRGRNTQNTMVVFPKNANKPGDYVEVIITGCTQGTLFGTQVVS
ncbi:MAG TPA: tRNA (N6-isopentenyl adenosine(37)-C2)-methylthiotransferase MiaB [Cytophagaceae bacterium]|jgi:tRNA-2-methylthio-N6-dimethylallyladenosine synthase